MTRPDRVRVLRVIARMNMGGPAYNVAFLGGRLDPDRFESLLLTGRVGPGEASLEKLAEANGAAMEFVEALGPELDPVDDLRAFVRIVQAVRRFRPDIVHTHTAKAGMLGRLAAYAIRPRPLVLHTYHGHVLEGYFGPARTALYRFLEKMLGRRTDRLVAVSAATVDELVRIGVAPRHRFSVVRDGLDLEPFLALDGTEGRALRAELGVAPDEVVLLYIGRLVPIKRLDVLLDAVARARRSGVPLRLWLAGDGPERPRLARLAAGQPVTFLGYRSDLPALAAAADLGVLSSDNEGTPTSLIELAAAARPLAATDVGGVREVVGPGGGILVPRRDPEALGEAIARLAADADLRRRAGREAREHVRGRFASDRLVRDAVALYEELLDERSGPSARLSRQRGDVGGQGQPDAAREAAGGSGAEPTEHAP